MCCGTHSDVADSGQHWCLLVADVRKKTVTIVDSLSSFTYTTCAEQIAYKWKWGYLKQSIIFNYVTALFYALLTHIAIQTGQAENGVQISSDLLLLGSFDIVNSFPVCFGVVECCMSMWFENTGEAMTM